jgi:hypothetical protein
MLSAVRRFAVSQALWIAGIGATALISIAMHAGQAPQTAQASSPQTKPSDKYLNARAGVEYVGDESCRTCHSSIYTQFKQTGMGRSTAVPSSADLSALAKPIKLVDKESHRTYSVYARDGKMFHQESETDATGHTVFSETHEIAYTVGAGDVGKSYLIANGDALFVSPISYYTRIGGWDLSPGYKQGFFQGFTRRVVDLCVDCHTGMPQVVAGTHNRFQQPPFRFLTVGCERCHGPGAIHVRQHTQEASTGESGLDPIEFSIVNPRKLRSEVRDDVCAQCHLAGDARVLLPGKDYLDFRPGTPLGEVAAIFSVPQTIKGNHFVALDQFEQMKMSQCWAGSAGRLGCISCHDPHVQLHSDQAAEFFRGRCLECHTTNSCRAPKAQRQATAPADNCVQCHMPKQATENIGHSSVTDHRILRTQSEIPAALQSGPSADSTELIPDTKPSERSTKEANLRNLALAYAQVAGHYPELGEKGLATLEQAVAQLQNDAEVQAAYGLVLSVARPREEQRATQALQKAVDLGSQSVEVRTHLASLRMRQGQVTAAIALYKESIQIEPYLTPAYVALARIDELLKEKKNALELLDDVLRMDPGNDAVREERRKVAATEDSQ